MIKKYEVQDDGNIQSVPIKHRTSRVRQGVADDEDLKISRYAQGMTFLSDILFLSYSMGIVPSSWQHTRSLTASGITQMRWHWRISVSLICWNRSAWTEGRCTFSLSREPTRTGISPGSLWTESENRYPVDSENPLAMRPAGFVVVIVI